MHWEWLAWKRSPSADFERCQFVARQSSPRNCSGARAAGKRSLFSPAAIYVRPSGDLAGLAGASRGTNSTNSRRCAGSVL